MQITKNLKVVTLFFIFLSILSITGCDRGDDARGGGGTIKGINHTHWAINHFSVNNQSAIDIIGPWQGGGGGCCFGVSEKWKPGMTVKVDWQTGEASTKDFPGFENTEKYRAWEKMIINSHRNITKTVPVPDYNGKKTCGITVHFFPCDKIKVTTSCDGYGNPRYPIKEPIEMEEPKSCPK
ncbi:DUF3304 domain-containing protein [Pantoea sp. USHLN256]|uniref:DUF3304 domain-containing protein n=1 Tax=Pantoea sp. USHLN256 TaxID=3081293 RepID=UPI003FA6DFDA